MTLCYSHKKEDPFTRIDKKIVFDKNLTWKAKGILLYAFSRPNDWTFYRSEMISHSSDGETSFDSGIKELETTGYLHRQTVHQPNTGKFSGCEWHFFEEPISGEEFKKRYRNGGNPGTGESPSPVKPQTTKKDSYTKKEENNNSIVVEPSACVVSPCLNKLKISQEFKISLSKEHDEQKLELLVKRVLKWEARSNDGVGCNTILNAWDTWSDETTLKDREERKEVEMDDLADKARKRKERAVKLKERFPEANFEVVGDSINQKFETNNRTSVSVLYFVEDGMDRLLDRIEGNI